MQTKKNAKKGEALSDQELIEIIEANVSGMHLLNDTKPLSSELLVKLEVLIKLFGARIIQIYSLDFQNDVELFEIEM